ncbi:PH domain-containing protein [Blastococcus goldschmidtiae]|uniref:PH domain-containing protein n=1 Tax=Blastococcus goldschmidtiae TaxID=3075546 RepID=A0ABU2KAR3_9ACTN|nr:PH domain-containing protein [Blastococcus sp. DSM 46792]MDT0277276.1 PH domain-containing protein [Blastococcus sp. DSM 46792]
MDTPARFGTNRATLLAVLVFALCLTTLTAASPWFLLLLVVPAVLAAWVLRTGFDVTGDAVTVHSLLGRRRVPWSEVAGVRIGERGDLWLVTTGGTEVRLPAVRARDLPAIGRASGGRIPVPELPDGQ